MTHEEEQREAERREAELEAEKAAYLRSLKENRRVIDTRREDDLLPPGVTHVLVKDEDDKPARLVERRKSFF